MSLRLHRVKIHASLELHRALSSVPTSKIAGENISAIPPAKFHVYLADGRSEFDEGCNNEPLRVLSDSGHAEEKVNTAFRGRCGHRFHCTQNAISARSDGLVRNQLQRMKSAESSVSPHTRMQLETP